MSELIITTSAIYSHGDSPMTSVANTVAMTTLRLQVVTVARSRPWKRIPHELPTALADIANNPNKKGYWDYSDTEEEL